MVDIDAARRFLAAEFENVGLPHLAGAVLAGISPYGKGAYIAAVAAALSNRQQVDLGQPLRNLVAAAKYMRDRVVETRGVKCMDDLDLAIEEADRALSVRCSVEGHDHG
ncbi:hypothetical protein JY455_03120 [Stenotrophomonas maltophilia]|nr:hypothetical protein [Stenotrophomonas maltophilia]